MFAKEFRIRVRVRVRVRARVRARARVGIFLSQKLSTGWVMVRVTKWGQSLENIR